MTSDGPRPGRHDRPGDTHITGSHGVLIGSGTQKNYLSLMSVPPKVVALVVIVLVALVGVVLYLKPWAATPDVRLVGYRVAPPDTVDGTDFEEFSQGDGPMQRSDQGKSEVPVTPVDITLKNNGAASAVVVEANVTLVLAEHLADCAQSGGPLQVEADYGISLPVDPPGRPFTVSRDIRFEVEPHRSERFTLTIGPEVQFVESWDARIYVADVSLKLDYRSRPLDIGRAGWVTRSGDGYDNLNAGLGRDQPCLKDNAAKMARFAALTPSAQRSEEAETLVKRWSRLTASDGAVHRPTCWEETGYDPTAEIAGLCALYAKDVLVASVRLNTSPPEGQPLLIRLSGTGGALRQVILCNLSRKGKATHEVTLASPDARASSTETCSDYQADQSRVFLYAYPEREFDADELRISAQLLPVGQQSDTGSPPSPDAPAVVVRRVD